MTYDDLRSRLLAVALLAGAPIALASALVYSAGIDVNPDGADWGSGVEGLVGYVGYLLLLPAWLHLAARAGRVRPVLGAVATVAALVGAAGALANMTARVVIAALDDAGVPAEVWLTQEEQFLAGEAGMLLFVLMSGTFGPLASVLVGVAFLRSPADRRDGVLLIVAGVLFVSGQAAQIGVVVLYPLALAVWALVMVPRGVALWRDRSEADVAEPALG